MPYFIRLRTAGETNEVWRIEGDTATDAMVTNPEHGVARQFKARDGETVWDRIKAETPWFEPEGVNPFHQVRLGPGEHNPRIARPLARTRDDFGTWSPDIHLEPQVVAASRSQAHSLLRQLERICQTVQPGPKTFDAFGHDIRNLLLLACMEVETHWRGVLAANGAGRARFTTKDYVLLADIMKLRDYAVRFPAFPEIEPIRPFEGWGLGQQPTEDLPWYAAHHAVKHNREEEFEKANLWHAFQAMSGCAVMLSAQYGQWALGRQTDLSAFFHLVEKPSWTPGDCYIGLPGLPSGTPTHLGFSSVPHPTLLAVQDKIQSAP